MNRRTPRAQGFVPGRLYGGDPGQANLVFVIASSRSDDEGYIVATVLEFVWHAPWELFVEDVYESSDFVRLT